MKQSEQIAVDRLDLSESANKQLDIDSAPRVHELPGAGEAAQANEVAPPCTGSLKDRIKESAISYRLRNRNFYLMLLIDAAIFAAVHIFSYIVRFEFKLNPLRIEQILLLLPYLVPLKIVIFCSNGLYRGMYRYTGLVDSWKLARATLLSTFLLVASILYFNRFEGFSRGVFIIDGALTFILAGAFRIGIRMYYANKTGVNVSDYFIHSRKGYAKEGWKRALIIGAGNAGEQILREIFSNPQHKFHVVGFMDDDRAKIGSSLHGLPIFNKIDQLPKIIRNYAIEQVLIAIPSGNGARIRQIAEICEQFYVECQTLPSLAEILDRRVTVSDFRPLNYQDLLRRPPVNLDLDGISDYLLGKVVLVTGCGGSIGSELCRQIMRFQPQKLILIDASEENLFNIQTELLYDFKFKEYHSILARVQNQTLINNVFRRYRPNVVFHAAAYKHVPIMEMNPWEAFFNNIMASWAVMEASNKFCAERFVLVSTDKAVRPANVMGASKRVAELLLKSHQGNKTRFMAVRFGNVLGSSGSVVPLFQKQIRNGGPITVTHPEITRYFMTISEAVKLILQAGSMGKGGEIFVLKMGTSVKIVDMARDLIRLSGKEPEKDIQIIFTGLRPGEKLYEELINDMEEIDKTVHNKIMLLKCKGQINDFKNNRELKEWLNQQLSELKDLGLRMDAEGIKAKLKQIVCEYTPQTTECVLGERSTQIRK